MVPYIPPSEYDLTMVVERKENSKLSESRACPWNKRQVSLVIEGKGPGIDDVHGAGTSSTARSFFRNETTTKGPFLAAGQAEHDHHHGCGS